MMMDRGDNLKSTGQKNSWDSTVAIRSVDWGLSGLQTVSSQMDRLGHPASGT